MDKAGHAVAELNNKRRGKTESSVDLVTLADNIIENLKRAQRGDLVPERIDLSIQLAEQLRAGLVK